MWKRPTLKSALILLPLAGLYYFYEKPPDRLFAQARRAVEQDDFESAATLYRELAVSYPESSLAARAHYELAQIYYLRRRDAVAARAQLRKVLTDYPDSQDAGLARQLLARLYEDEFQDLEKALHEYKVLIGQKLDADSRRRVLIAIADCQYALNRLDEAASAYRNALQLPYHEESDAAYLRLANLLLLAGSGEEALEQLRELEKRTTNPEHRQEALCREVEILTGLQRFSEAKQRLADEGPTYPGSEELRTARARLVEAQRTARSLDGADQADLLEELQKKIHWGGGRRRARSRPPAAPKP